MKLWHFTYYVDKNDPNSEIECVKVHASTGKMASKRFDMYCGSKGYDPFVTVFRCEGEVK